jgi:hypothetical protein
MYYLIYIYPVNNSYTFTTTPPTRILSIICCYKYSKFVSYLQKKLLPTLKLVMIRKIKVSEKTILWYEKRRWEACSGNN